jgi:hypothetical protein
LLVHNISLQFISRLLFSVIYVYFPRQIGIWIYFISIFILLVFIFNTAVTHFRLALNFLINLDWLEKLIKLKELRGSKNKTYVKQSKKWKSTSVVTVCFFYLIFLTNIILSFKMHRFVSIYLKIFYFTLNVIKRDHKINV